MINLLFVCSRTTAEQIWRRHPGLNVRSAGTGAKARRKVSAKDIEWADVIMVMEEKHQARLRAEFTRLIAHKKIYVLDIPDDYHYMDPELILELQNRVPPLLGLE